MRYAFLLVALVFAIATSAQKVEYGYEACGNRVLRQVVLDGANKSLSIDNQLEDFSEEQIGEVQVRIYPNPTHGRLKVVLQGAEKEHCNINIYDVNGRQVANVVRVENENDIDLSSEPNGIYLMRFSINGEVSTWKIIKK